MQSSYRVRLRPWSAALALALAAGCTAGATGSGVGANAAMYHVVRSSARGGGTLHAVVPQDWDSPDPGNTYYSWTWDFSRLYARPLLSYENAPGSGGLRPVPDLATSLGTPSDGDRTWTFHIRSGVRYADGGTVTSADVKYAIERSNWGHAVLSTGPQYFYDLIDPRAPGGQYWPGPYVDRGGSLPDSMIATPNPTTIVFHLVRPFADFDYLATLPDTAPVPERRDTGSTYGRHVDASGPYRIDSYTPGVGMTLSRNPYWDPRTDPWHLHPQHVDRIVVRTMVAANTVDDRLLADSADVDLSGGGLQTSAADHVLTSRQLTANTDDPYNGALVYAALDDKVKPFTDLDCREAVEYAVNKVELMDQQGGPTEGSIATTILPPTMLGYRDYPNPYATAGERGDPTRARALLADCRSQLGASFTNRINLATVADSPQAIGVMTAMESQLRAIGFAPTLFEYPAATYQNTFETAAYEQAHHLGVLFDSWQADWPDGYGFLSGLVGGGQTNPMEFSDPTIDAMLTAAINDSAPASREQRWWRIDQAVMRQAVIVPLVYNRVLLYRPVALTNVMVAQAYGMYDDSTLGVAH